MIPDFDAAVIIPLATSYCVISLETSVQTSVMLAEYVHVRRRSKRFFFFAKFFHYADIEIRLWSGINKLYSVLQLQLHIRGLLV